MVDTDIDNIFIVDNDIIDIVVDDIIDIVVDAIVVCEDTSDPLLNII